MRMAVNSHALPIYKKNRIASLLCIFETTIEPDFPCLADEIVEPRPDMNIKAAAFTESKKSNYTTFSCSTLLSTKFILLINVKMSTTPTYSLTARKLIIFQQFSFK